MKSVFLKELGAFFRGRRGWIMLAVLTLFNGFFLSYFHFFLGNTRYEIVIGTMMFCVALLLPIWVVPRLCDEQNKDEERLLSSLPLTEAEILFGKMLASMTLLFCMILVLGIFPLALFFFGGTQFGYAYLALAVAFFLGCALLAGIAFFSVLFRKKILAWIASYAFVGILFVCSRLAAGATGTFGTILSYASLFDAFSPLAYDLFTWEILLLYAGVALGFFGATLLVLGGRKKLAIGKKGIVSVLLAVVLLTSMAGTAFLPAHAKALDMSSEGTMSVSVTTENYLNGLDTDVTLYLLTDDLSDDPYRDHRFEAFLERYASYGDRVTLEYLPVSESGSLLAEFGITAPTAGYAYCIIAKSDQRSRIISFSDMLYYIHNNQTLAQLIPNQFSYSQYESYLTVLYQYAQSDSNYLPYYSAFLNDVKLHFVGETLLNELIEYVSADLIPQPYVLTGHGEPDVKGLLLGSLLSGYGALTLSDVDEVPADAASLLLMSPAKDYTADEVRKLSEYLNRGGTLTVVTGEANLDMPNLMGLLSAYGLSAEKGAVRAEIEKTSKDEEGEEMTETVITDSVPVNVDGQHDALAALSGVGIRDGMIKIQGGNAISFHKTEDTSLVTTALLTTVDTAFVAEETEKTSYVLGAAAETADGAHLVWFTGAGSYLLTSSDITAESEESLFYPTFCPYLTASWTNLRYVSNVAEIPPVLYEEPYLGVGGTSMAVFALIFVLAAPAGLVSLGLVRHYKRKKA